MKISVRVKTAKRVVIDKIKETFANFLNTKFKRKNSAIKTRVRKYIYAWVRQQPEMQDILAGKYGSLAPHFGIPEGTHYEVVEKICVAAANAFTIEVVPVNKNLVGGVYLNFIGSTFSDLLSLEEGYVDTEKGEKLHWLDWLLNRGFQTLVIGYHFMVKVDDPNSRSGGGIMVKRGTWRVPPEFAGTIDDNFITRAISMPENEIQLKDIIQEYIS
jgi:hypothetical protein